MFYGAVYRLPEGSPVYLSDGYPMFDQALQILFLNLPPRQKFESHGSLKRRPLQDHLPSSNPGQI